MPLGRMPPSASNGGIFFSCPSLLQTGRRFEDRASSGGAGPGTDDNVVPFTSGDFPMREREGRPAALAVQSVDATSVMLPAFLWARARFSGVAHLNFGGPAGVVPVREDVLRDATQGGLERFLARQKMSRRGLLSVAQSQENRRRDRDNAQQDRFDGIRKTPTSLPGLPR
jgi:hypothetical protein